MKNVFDLTRKLHSGMPVYPGTPAPHFVTERTIDQHGYRETSLSLCSHVGTHMDAPAHMVGDGKTLDAYPPERFFGKGLVADLSKYGPDRSVEWEMLSPFEREAMAKVAFLFFDTGYDADHDAVKAFAVPSPGMLRRAVELGVCTVGIDRMSIDKVGSMDMKLHGILFSYDVLILENLTGLSALHGIVFSVCALPLLYENADGAPTRVIVRTP